MKKDIKAFGVQGSTQNAESLSVEDEAPGRSCAKIKSECRRDGVDGEADEQRDAR